MSQLRPTGGVPPLSVSTPTLFHPSAFLEMQLLKDFDKADLLPCS